MAFERIGPGGIIQQNNPERILNIESYKYDKDGKIIKGDYPEAYIRKLPAFLSTPGILAVKNESELKFDFWGIQIINRLDREKIPEEDFEINDYIIEINSEAAAKSNNTRNKDNKYNLGFNTVANISVSETTTKNIEAQPKRGGLLNWFRRQ